MSRDSDALANILKALYELESSGVISDITRLKIQNLKTYVECEIRIVVDEEDSQSHPKSLNLTR